jgi:hypothetical protein
MFDDGIPISAALDSEIPNSQTSSPQLSHTSSLWDQLFLRHGLAHLLSGRDTVTYSLATDELSISALIAGQAGLRS